MQENSMSTPIRPLSDTAFPSPAALSSDPVRTPRLVENTNRSRLESAAETAGTTLGRAVSTVRDLPRRFSVIKGGAGDKASQVAEEATAKLDDIKVEARNRAQLLRSRAQIYVHDYPLQVIGGVFAFAFFAGMTLRIWRTRD
jgi:hypothetical protein